MKDNKKFVDLYRVSVIETTRSLSNRYELRKWSEPWKARELEARLNLGRRLKAKIRKLGYTVLAQGFVEDKDAGRLTLCALCHSSDKELYVTPYRGPSLLVVLKSDEPTR